MSTTYELLLPISDHWAHSVVASHPLRMRKALGSNPSVSIHSLKRCTHLHITRTTTVCRLNVCAHRTSLSIYTYVLPWRTSPHGCVPHLGCKAARAYAAAGVPDASTWLRIARCSEILEWLDNRLTTTRSPVQFLVLVRTLPR